MKDAPKSQQDHCPNCGRSREECPPHAYTGVKCDEVRNANDLDELEELRGQCDRVETRTLDGTIVTIKLDGGDRVLEEICDGFGDRPGCTIVVNGVRLHLEGYDPGELREKIAQGDIDDDPDYYPQTDDDGLAWLASPYTHP